MGKKLEQIDVPENPANVCFGGDDFRTLFITARTSLYSIELKHAGARTKGSKGRFNRTSAAKEIMNRTDVTPALPESKSISSASKHLNKNKST